MFVVEIYNGKYEGADGSTYSSNMSQSGCGSRTPVTFLINPDERRKAATTRSINPDW